LSAFFSKKDISIVFNEPAKKENFVEDQRLKALIEGRISALNALHKINVQIVKLHDMALKSTNERVITEYLDEVTFALHELREMK